jgi:hypothetical protein
MLFLGTIFFGGVFSFFLIQIHKVHKVLVSQSRSLSKAQAISVAQVFYAMLSIELL